MIHNKVKVHKNDEILHDLAYYTMRCHAYPKNTGQPKQAYDLLLRWRRWNGNDYMKKADDEWTEKRIELYLRLLATSAPTERKPLAACLAGEIRDYAQVALHCPDGFYSKNVYKMVDDILDPV